MQYVVFLALAPVAAAVLVLVAGFAWRRRGTPPAANLLWLALATLGWLIANSLELISASPSGTLWWGRVAYVFIAATALAWLAFAIQYVGRQDWLTPSRLVPLALVPAITSFLSLTSAAHGFLWADYRLVPAGGFLHLWIEQYGPWFWMHVLYCYACILLGAGLILAHFLRAAKIYRRQAGWVVVGALCAVVVNVAYVFRLIPGWRKDYSPLALAWAGLFFAVGIFRHRLLDLRPVGRNQLVESIRDAVIVVDTQHRIVDVNPAARGVLSNWDGGLIGEPVSDILPVASSALVSSPPGQPAQEEISIERDGETRYYELRLSDVADTRGRLMGRLLVLRDVTERRETMMQLRRQERLAAIGQLAGGVAHDFNNLLASIILHAQLAQKQQRNDRSGGVEENLRVIVQESRRAADLVTQILDFSRSAVMESEPLDLGDLLEDVASVLRRTIREDIHLMVETPSSACVVEADPTRIQQMLLNLATNARDAMPDGGELRIAVKCRPASRGCDGADAGAPPERWAHLTVSDTGTGIDEEVQSHLFEPFFTTKEPGEGTGLGLAQVYGIVNQHRGCIEVETELGKGTTFHVFLPLHDVQPLARGGGERAPEPRGDGETILLVEDEHNLREACRDTLSGLGYQVVAAANGRDALARLNGREADLVITDLVMPEMGGKRLMRELVRRSPDLPVLAVTGYTMRDQVDRLIDIGFCDVLHKPFDACTLARAVHRHLRDNGSCTGTDRSAQPPVTWLSK